jgi:hypothetical protein
LALVQKDDRDVVEIKHRVNSIRRIGNESNQIGPKRCKSQGDRFRYCSLGLR